MIFLKNEIAYYYHLYPEQLIKKGNTYFFNYQNKRYSLEPYKRNLDEIENLYLLNRILVEQNIFFPKLLVNVMNQVLTSINGRYYCLKEELLPQEKVRIEEIIYPMSYTLPVEKLKNIRRDQWAQLWESKIDYFEYQRSHIEQKFPKLVEGLDYFIGMSENAIAYVKTIEKTIPKTRLDTLTFARRRVKAKSTLSEFYDPLSFVMDYKVRDIAEFIKSCFFETDILETELEKWILSLQLSDYGFGMFFGRMLFPSYYFDLYENIINGKENENKIEQVLSKIDAYIEFLNTIALQITRRHSIPFPQWISSKKEVL